MTTHGSVGSLLNQVKDLGQNLPSAMAVMLYGEPVSSFGEGFCNWQRRVAWLQPYLAVGMIAKGFVGFINNQTFDVHSRTGATREVIDHDLRGEEKHSPGVPQLLAAQSLGSSWKSERKHQRTVLLRTSSGP